MRSIFRRMESSKDRASNIAFLPTLGLFCAIHSTTHLASSLLAGNLCSGASRYSTFTTIHGESLKRKCVEKVAYIYEESIYFSK